MLNQTIYRYSLISKQSERDRCVESVILLYWGGGGGVLENCNRDRMSKKYYTSRTCTQIAVDINGWCFGLR